VTGHPITARAPLHAATVVGCDLDRTLIYSRGALGLARQDRPDLICVEYYQGRPLSFMTARAADLFRELCEVAAVVPATTRTRAQFSRIALPGPAPRYAIAANGGHLLDGGEPDLAWNAAVTKTLRAASAPLEQVWDHVRTVCSPAFTSTVRRADDLFVYAVVERTAMPDGLLAELTAWAGELGWSVSLQGRKLYVVPLTLTKSAALAEVARRTGADVVLAAGDSLLDRDMLAAADAAIRPGHGELHESDWRAEHVVSTRNSGVLAGEELLGWLLAGRQAGRWTPRRPLTST